MFWIATFVVDPFHHEFLFSPHVLRILESNLKGSTPDTANEEILARLVHKWLLKLKYLFLVKRKFSISINTWNIQTNLRAHLCTPLFHRKGRDDRLVHIFCHRMEASFIFLLKRKLKSNHPQTLIFIEEKCQFPFMQLHKNKP